MKNSDQPAYPTFIRGTEERFHGLTKRELFAAMAMPEFLKKWSPENAAKMSVEAADALRTELDKENVCEWRQVGLTYKTNCNRMSVRSIDGNFCPYCGRKIKEVK